ncbi:MAG: response regulator, partial [Planctomycetes bacterium]|nr:response regulator [Planctomycetota bacterium]
SLGMSTGLTPPQVWGLHPTDDQLHVGTLGGGIYSLQLEETVGPPPRVHLLQSRSSQGRARVRWQPLSYWGETPPDVIATRFRVDDGDWSSWGYQREMEIEPGSGGRGFEVQARSGSGSLGPVATLTIDVAPASAARRWAVIIAVAWLVTVSIILLETWRRRRRSRAQVRKLELEVARARRFESLGLLTGGIAHDFNNLLACVRMNVASIQRDIGTGDPLGDRLSEIDLAAERASELTRQLLAYSGRGSSVVRDIDVGTLTREMVRICRALSSARVRWDVEIEPDLWIHGDPVQLRQSVMNLLVNANDALVNGAGSIRVRVAAARGPVVGSHYGTIEDERDVVCIDVHDDGVGISRADLPRIFEPSFSSKNHDRGLGLATVLGVARRHHGAIDVASEESRGTVVSLYVPRVPTPDESEYESAPGSFSSTSAGSNSTVSDGVTNSIVSDGVASDGLEGVAGPTTSRGRSVPSDSFVAPESRPPAARPAEARLLLCEDDPQVRRFTTQLLERRGYRVHSCASGAEAVAAFREHPRDFDLVLMDYVLPDASGIDALRSMRVDGVDVPAILISGHEVETVWEQDASSIGLRAMVRKPYRPEALIREIEGALTRR